MQKKEVEENLAILGSLIILSGYETDKEREKKQQQIIDRFCESRCFYPNTSQMTGVDPVQVFSRIQDKERQEEITGLLISFICGEEEIPNREKWIALSRLLQPLQKEKNATKK